MCSMDLDVQKYEVDVSDQQLWQSFEVNVERGSGIAQVRISGELDIATVAQLDHALDGLAGDGHHRLVLDLDHLQFMDARGLRSIVRAKRFADRHGGRLTIRRSSGQVQRLFELTNMLDYLSFD